MSELQQNPNAKSIVNEHSAMLVDLYREMAEERDAREIEAEISELSDIEASKFAVSQWTLI